MAKRSVRGDKGKLQNALSGVLTSDLMDSLGKVIFPKYGAGELEKITSKASKFIDSMQSEGYFETANLQPLILRLLGENGTGDLIHYICDYNPSVVLDTIKEAQTRFEDSDLEPKLKILWKFEVEQINQKEIDSLPPKAEG